MKAVAIIISIFFLQNIILLSKTFRVGAEQEYKVPSSVATLVQDGDTVLIDAGIYSGDVAIWRANYIILKGVGNTYAHLKAAGKSAEKKAIWVIKGDSNIVENIEFSDCKVADKNGAGIRLEGTDLVVNHCYFHDNQDGILLGKNLESEVIVRFSEFSYSGYGQGFSHNIYIGNIKKFIFEFCYTHHANKGHTIKSRAEENIIRYNRIMDTWDGVSSMLIDLPNGGNSFIVGNVLMQGENAENSKMITYGKEGLKNKINNLYVVNNTFVNYRHSAKFLDAVDGTNYIYMTNNIFAGVGGFVMPDDVDSINNVYYQNINDVFFVAPDSLNYHLSSQSPAIDLGKSAKYDLVPLYEYVHPLSFKERYKDNLIDLGAFEYQKPINVTENKFDEKLNIYPNPFNNFCKIQAEDFTQIKIFDILGNEIASFESQSQSNNNTICWYPKPNLKTGVYIIKVIYHKNVETKRILYLK